MDNPGTATHPFTATATATATAGPTAGRPWTTPDCLFFENFDGDLGRWLSYTTAPTDPGHNWTASGEAPAFAGPGKIRSDPGGPSLVAYYNRLDSATISTLGRKDVRLHFFTRHELATVGNYQLFVRNLNGDKVSLIGDYAGQSQGWPGFERKDVLIPSLYWNDPSIRVSLLLQSGAIGGDFGAEIDNVLVMGEPEEPQCGVAFFDSFEGGDLGAKWEIHNDPGTPGHIWGLQAAPPSSEPTLTEACSDPAGVTQPVNYTRLETRPFSLVGKTFAMIRLRARWKMGGDDRFQIFVADRDMANFRGLVREYLQQNPGYPANDSIEIPIPDYMMGREHVSVAFLSLTGSAGVPGTGAVIDDVQVLTDCTTP